MSITVFCAVLGAALLHAIWNALVKGGHDKQLAMTAVVMGHVPLALVIVPFVPMPAPESYPYLGASILLHMGYQLFLLNSYRIGDLTQVYPIARGIAPLIVAIISVALLGVQLKALQIAAILIIVCGIMSLSLVRKGDGQRNMMAAWLALGTGCFIAAYSLTDGLGVRVAGTSLGFYCWATFGNAILMALYARRFAPHVFGTLPKEGKKLFFIGGGASFAAYAIVTWAFMQAPIALVTALRETSIIFALLIGVLFLKEKFGIAKLIATIATLTGAVLLRFV